MMMTKVIVGYEDTKKLRIGAKIVCHPGFLEMIFKILRRILPPRAG